MKSIKYILASLLLLIGFSLLATPAISQAAEATEETIEFSGESPYYLYDGAGLFTDTQLDDLEQKMKDFYAKEKTYIVVLTENSLTEDLKTYLDDFYSSNMKKGDSAALLLVNMVSTNEHGKFQFLGFGKASYSDSAIKSMTDTITASLKAKDYSQAAGDFISDTAYYKNLTPIYLRWWVHLLIALLIGGITVFVLVYNAGGKVTTNSNTYLDAENSRLLGRRDTYIRTTVTRTKIERNTSSNTSKSGGTGGGGSF